MHLCVTVVITSSNRHPGATPATLPTPFHEVSAHRPASKLGQLLWVCSCGYNPDLQSPGGDSPQFHKLQSFPGLALFSDPWSCSPLTPGAVPQGRAFFHREKWWHVSFHSTIDITLPRNSWFWGCHSPLPPLHTHTPFCHVSTRPPNPLRPRVWRDWHLTCWCCCSQLELYPTAPSSARPLAHTDNSQAIWRPHLPLVRRTPFSKLHASWCLLFRPFFLNRLLIRANVILNVFCCWSQVCFIYPPFDFERKCRQ